MSKEIREYAAEAIGTFMLVFTGTGAIIINDVFPQTVTHVGIALTFGLVVMVMIYAIGDISGAHMNPAVTIGFSVARGFPFKKAVGYIVFQVIGALSASAMLRVLFLSHSTLGAALPSASVLQAASFECLLTFLLMFVILNVTTGAQEKGIIAGIAIGGTVGLEALFAGPVSGASMNPARSLAPALVSGRFAHLWVFILAQISGALAGCVATRYILGERS